MSRTPKLRTDLTLVEQTYRGEQSYIVKDPKTRKYFRFRPVEVTVIQRFDGPATRGRGGVIAGGGWAPGVGGRG